MTTPFHFLKLVYTHRLLIKAMTLQEIKSRYAGTLVGFMWSAIHPLMMILIFWFIFSIIFKVPPLGNTPFIVLFCCGMIPWSTFSEFITTSTSAIISNPHLVTKTVFPTEILPVVHLMASLITHFIMLVIFVAILIFNKFQFSFWNFQFLYYLFSLFIFSLGIGLLLSAVNVFYRDVGQMLAIILNMWFWLTPIVWHIDIVPKKYLYIIELNPMFYIVEGYRSSFIYLIPFWYNYRLGIYFWVLCFFLFAIGGIIFEKLKPEFAEVL